MGRGKRSGFERKRGGRWRGAKGAAATERGAADGAGRKGRWQKKEGRPMGRGDRGGAQTKRAADGAGREGLRRKKRGGRWCGARGADATDRGAADGAGREERRPNKDGRLIERGERKGGETKRAADVAGCRRGASDGLEVYRVSLWTLEYLPMPWPNRFLVFFQEHRLSFRAFSFFLYRKSSENRIGNPRKSRGFRFHSFHFYHLITTITITSMEV